MEIIVSSPGSPGTSFTDNVKEQIILLSDELDSHDDFDNLPDFKNHLKLCGLNANYVRNILPFLQYCGLVKYEGVTVFDNKNFFTNIGHAYVEVLKSLQIAKAEPDGDIKNSILPLLEKIQEEIYFQCLIIMMKNAECNYSVDFLDVLRFIDVYGHIDLTEYLLILYFRENEGENYIVKLEETVKQYRNNEIEVIVKTKTKNATDGDGETKSVNSFPYVTGNFQKAGIMEKRDNKFYFVSEKQSEIKSAIREVIKCQNLAK